MSIRIEQIATLTLAIMYEAIQLDLVKLKSWLLLLLHVTNP